MRRRGAVPGRGLRALAPLLLLALLCASGCAKKGAAGARPLNPYFRGRDYINTFKDYRLQLPPVEWRYEAVPGWDLSFRHHERTAQIFIDSRRFFFGGGPERALRKWFESFRLTPLSIAEQELTPRQVGNGALGIRYEGVGSIMVSRHRRFSVERRFVCFLYQRGARFFLFLYVAPAGDEGDTLPQFESVATSFWPSDASPPAKRGDEKARARTATLTVVAPA